MAGRKDKEKDSGQYITHEQVRELMEQQKVFYKELLQQQESNFNVCMYTFIETTSLRMDAIVKELQELKVSLQFTQKEVDDLKASSVSLSSNCKSNEDDIHKLADSMLVIDEKTDFLDAQTIRQNVINDGIPEAEKERGSDSEEKVLALFKDKLDLDPLTIRIQKVQRVGFAQQWCRF